MAELAIYDNDPTLYLFTSLTAGSSHIVTATSRIETILKANKIPFKGVDTATDDLARKLYGRRARGKKLPLLVKEGYVIADLEQVEEWNEYDELKEALGVSSAPAPALTAKPTSTTASASTNKETENLPSTTPEQNLAIRQLGAEAAKVAAAKKPTPSHISTTNPLLAEKVNSPAAVSTPTKDKSASVGGVLSPRSVPLPATPAAPKSPAAVGKGVPRGMGLGPMSPPPTEFHGAKVESPGEEQIRLVEKEQRIEEVSSEDEEDDEEEEEEEEEDEEDEETDSEEDEEDEEEEKKQATAVTEDSKAEEGKVEAQDKAKGKDASK